MSFKTKPLTNEDFIALNRTGENFKSVLNGLFSQFPQSAHSISGMSKWLDYNKSNCQRILNALQKSRNGKEVLTLLPGISGLDDFISKLKHVSLQKQHILELENVVQAFNHQIKLYAKSHAHLKRLLTDNEPNKITDTVSLSAQQKRNQHFLCSKQLLSSSIKTLFSCYVLTENQNDKQFLQEVAMITKIGIERSKASPPFVQFYTHPNPAGFIAPDNVTSNSRIDTSKFQIGIIDEFSDPNLADSYSSFSASNSGIVFNDLDSNAPFDASFLFSNPDELANPLVHQSKCSSTSISIKSPTEKLVMMVFLDKKLDMRSSVNVGCYSNNQRVEEGKLRASDMWTERLPEFPELNVLHSSSERAKIIGTLKVGDMSDYLFNYANLNKDDFVCYMMEVEYPIWSSTYRIYFEHC